MIWGLWTLKGSSNVFFRRVSSEQSYCFALNEAVFNAWWVTQGEVCALEGFGRVVVSVDVQDGILGESFPFEHCGVKAIGFVLWYFSRKFDGQVEFVSLVFFLSQSQREKYHQCSISILLAWYRFVRLFSFQFPPWKYWQRILPL